MNVTNKSRQKFKKDINGDKRNRVVGNNMNRGGDVEDTDFKVVSNSKKQQRSSRNRPNHVQKPELNFIDKFEIAYPKAILFFEKIIGVVYNISKTLLVTVLPIIIYFGLLSVEHHRLETNLAVVETNPQYASIFAYVIIFAALFFEAAIVITKHNNGYQKLARTRNLRSVVAWLSNLFDEPIQKPEHSKFESALTFIVLTIIGINTLSILTLPAPIYDDISNNLIAVIMSNNGADNTAIITMYSGVNVALNLLLTLFLVFVSIYLTNFMTVEAISAGDSIQGRARKLENTNVHQLSEITPILNSTVYSQIVEYKDYFDENDTIDLVENVFTDGKNGAKTKAYSSIQTTLKHCIKALEARKNLANA